MKKIKFMLTVICVFSIVGGALAFKARKRNIPLYCGNQGGIANTPPCPLVAQNKTFLLTTTAASFCTTVAGQLCNSRAVIGPDRP